MNQQDLREIADKLQELVIEVHAVSAVLRRIGDELNVLHQLVQKERMRRMDMD